MQASITSRCNDCGSALPDNPIVVLIDNKRHLFGCENCAAGFLAGHLCLCDCLSGPWCKCQPKQRSSERE